MDLLLAEQTTLTESDSPLRQAVLVAGTSLEALPRSAADEAFEWRVSLDGSCSDWRDLDSRFRAVELVRSIDRGGDWLTIQSKNLDQRASGRYAQVMNTGSAYLVELAQKDYELVRNWRVGLGSAADDAGNEPYEAVTSSQQLVFAGVTEVVDSWLRGHGIPLGYGAALHVYG